MKTAQWTSALLLGSIAEASVLPWKRVSHVVRDVTEGVGEEVMVVTSSIANVQNLAAELIVDELCLIDANPEVDYLNVGDACFVPYACCGTSCAGDFCSRRFDCHNQTTSSAPAQASGTTTSVVSTITTSVDSSIVAPVEPSSEISLPANNSTAASQSVPAPDGQLTTSSTPASVPPVGSGVQPASSIVLPSRGASLPSGIIPPTASGIVTSSSAPAESVPVNGSGIGSVPDGSASSGPPPSSSSLVASISVITTSDSLPGPPPSNTSVYATDSLGPTIISDASGATTIPTGISTASLVTLPDGSIVTYVPSPSASNPIGTSSAIETSASAPASGSSAPPLLPIVTTTSDGVTIISDTSGAVTLPTGITTSTVLTLPDGTVVTYVPKSPSTNSSQVPSNSTSSAPITFSSSSSVPLTGSSSSGSTSIGSSSSSSPITSSSAPPSGSSSSAASTSSVSSSTASAGDEGSSSSDPTDEPTGSASDTPSPTSSPAPPVGIIPITTSVSEPEPTDGGTIIPCNFWFFNICIDWEDTEVGGWLIDLPEGIRPPGPPPPITFPPELSITVSVSGTLPPWPSLTVGPDLIPTFEPKPEEECETESAELCLTKTSYGVDSATVTTTSEVLSTCATVLGCNVEDSSSSTTVTSSSSGYPYYCTAGCSACMQRRHVATSTAAIPQVTAFTIVKKSIIAYARNLTLNKRDIPLADDYDGISDLYSAVQASSPVQVPLDQGALSNGVEVGIPSSRFRYFDDSEFNVVVRGLRGCTSVVVVSRLGVYATHFWEGPAFNGLDSSFQSDVLDYLVLGRDAEISSGETEALTDLVEAGVFGDTETTKIFIMTPATMDLDLDENTPSSEAFGSLTQGNQPSLYGSGGNRDRLGPIRDQLDEILPGVPISEFVYRRQTQDNLLRDGAYGAAMILYSNSQVVDPADIMNDLEAPQKAIWQCWMEGSMMGSDIWDALPGQSGSCSDGNQKRQDGGVCSLSVSAPNSATATSGGASASSSLTGSSTSSGSSAILTDMPTLTTSSATISTPAGSSCVATSTSSECVRYPGNAGTGCVPVPVCTSFVATTTSTTSSVAEPTVEPTGSSSPEPTGQVYINIYTDDDCIEVHEQINMNAIGESYQPTDDEGEPLIFNCFSVTYLSDAAINTGALAAIKDPSCFVQDDTDESEYMEYPDLLDIQYDDEQPFDMGCLVLISKPE